MRSFLKNELRNIKILNNNKILIENIVKHNDLVFNTIFSKLDRTLISSIVRNNSQ